MSKLSWADLEALYHRARAQDFEAWLALDHEVVRRLLERFRHGVPAAIQTWELEEIFHVAIEEAMIRLDGRTSWPGFWVYTRNAALSQLIDRLRKLKARPPMIRRVSEPVDPVDPRSSRCVAATDFLDEVSVFIDGLSSSGAKAVLARIDAFLRGDTTLVRNAELLGISLSTFKRWLKTVRERYKRRLDC